jgi:hypothetical protein
MWWKVKRVQNRVHFTLDLFHKKNLRQFLRMVNGDSHSETTDMFTTSLPPPSPWAKCKVSLHLSPTRLTQGLCYSRHYIVLRVSFYADRFTNIWITATEYLLYNSSVSRPKSWICCTELMSFIIKRQIQKEINFTVTVQSEGSSHTFIWK